MNSLSVMRIQNDVLIPLVEKRPVLWDNTFEVPKRKKSKRAWKDLCRELHDKFEELDDEEKDEYVKALKQRWQCLKDTFLKKKDSGSSGVKKYIYAEKLQFLEKVADSIESPIVAAGCSTEPSEDVSTPEPSKLTADLAFQKTHNFGTLKNPEADNIECMSSGDESFKSVQTSCSDESMLADEQHEDRFELPKDRFPKGFLKNGFTEPPKDRSTPKQQANDLHKEVSEEINDLKTRKKFKMSEDMDKSCTNESPEDILIDLTEEFRLTDEPNEDESMIRITELPKNRFPPKMQNNESIDGLAKARSTSKRVSSKAASNLVSQKVVPGKTVHLKKKRKSKPESADPKNLTDDHPSEGSSDELLKDVFAEKLQKYKPSKELSKRKSSKNQGKSKSVDQLPGNRTSKRLHESKCTGQLPDNRTSKRLHESKCTYQLPDNRTSKRLRESKCTDQLSTDKLVEDSTEVKFLSDSSADKSTNDLSQNGSTTKSSKWTGNRSTDMLSDDLSQNEFPENRFTKDRPTEKLLGGLYRNGCEPPILEAIDQHTGQSESSEVLGSMQFKRTFNLFLHSITPHLNKLDESEVLEFQMGVLQVIGRINEWRKGASLQFSDPPSISKMES